MAELRRCDYCGRIIAKSEQGYGLNIEMFALADPLELTEEDLEKDYGAELRALIEKMEHLDVREEEAKVHEIYRFVLCGGCRAGLHERLKARLRSS